MPKTNTTFYSIFSLSLFSLSLSFTALAVGPKEPFTDADLLAQAQKPFAQKFKRVLGEKTLQALSNENLARIEAAVGLDAAAAAKAGEAYLSRYQIAHETSVSTALKILDSEKFRSLDDLVAGKVLPPNKKYSVSKPDLDGEIGEQDVVFTAIRDANPDRDAYTFGNVAFLLDNQTLEDGYFTFFPFGMIVGRIAGSVQLFPAIKGQNEPAIQKTLPIYRSQIFHGKETLQRLFGVMSTLRSDLRPRLAPVAGAFESQLEEIRKAYAQMDIELKSDDPVEATHRRAAIESRFAPSYVARAVEACGLQLPTEAEFHIAKILKDSGAAKKEYWHQPMGWKTEDSRELIKLLNSIAQNDDSHFSDLIHSAKLLPGTGPLSYIYNGQYGFWELKVPKSLSVDRVNGVRLYLGRGCHPSSGCWDQVPEKDIDALRSRLKILAKKRGHAVGETRTEKMIEFKL